MRLILSRYIFIARSAASKNSDRQTDVARKFHVRGEPWPVKLNRVISFRAMDSHGFARKHCAGSSWNLIYEGSPCRFIIVLASTTFSYHRARDHIFWYGYKLYRVDDKYRDIRSMNDSSWKEKKREEINSSSRKILVSKSTRLRI